MSFHTSHQAGSKTSGSAAGVKFSPGCTVCSECAHILTHQFVWLCCPASHSRGEKKKKKPGHGDDTAAGGAKPEFSTGTTELGAFREAEGGEERCGASPTCLGTWKGLVDHSLWGDWMQRRRPPAGHNKDGLDCEKRASGRESALDSELRSRRGSSLSTHWPPLV